MQTYHVQTLCGDHCLTAEAGQSLYDQILPALQAGHPVTLDFHGITVVASPFFNRAIGQLYKELTSDQLNQFLTLTNVPAYAMEVLHRVIENARTFYTTPGGLPSYDDLLLEQNGPSA